MNNLTQGIEIGEYLKTDSGYIGKVQRIEFDKIDKSLTRYVFDYNEPKLNVTKEIYINKPYIVKHSKNLIDLIKAGDIVNGHLVIDKYEDVDEYGNDFWCLIIEDDSLLNKTIREEDIKTILTKEHM